MLTNNQLDNRVKALLNNLKLGEDGIWSSNLPQSEQVDECKLREEVAAKPTENYINEIAQHHSIPVMDYEVTRFLDSVKDNALILDGGGWWGWHWRKLREQKPAARVIIVDFIRSNLRHAQKMLGSLEGSQVVLVHADATALPFEDDAFDAFWTVQTFQHIPNFKLACAEAERVLKTGGIFVNYSLHITPIIRMLYKVFGKPYHIEGSLEGLFYLERASNRQRDIVSSIFCAEVKDRYTEIFFHPNLKLTFAAGENNLIGNIDAFLGGGIGSWFARQRSFEVIKK